MIEREKDHLLTESRKRDTSFIQANSSGGNEANQAPRLLPGKYKYENEAT